MAGLKLIYMGKFTNPSIHIPNSIIASNIHGMFNNSISKSTGIEDLKKSSLYVRAAIWHEVVIGRVYTWIK